MQNIALATSKQSTDDNSSIFTSYDYVITD